jgi:uncharacterized protein (TIGR02996 family)
MTDRDALIATVAATPADDLPRLVYADWLEEHGDPDQAGFIRRHVELTRRKPNLSAWNTLAAELKATAVRHAAGWVAPLAAAFGQPTPHWQPDPDGGWLARLWNRPMVAEALHRRPYIMPDGELVVPCNVRGGLRMGAVALEAVHYRRGVPENVTVNAGRVPDGSGYEVAVRTTPISGLYLRLSDDPDAWGRADGPWFDRLRFLSLSVEHTVVEDGSVTGPVFRSPHLTGLRALHLNVGVAFSDLPTAIAADTTGIHALIESPLPSRLQILRVPLIRDVITALAGYPARAPLAELCPGGEWSGELLDPDDWRALADLPFRPTLRRLSLQGCALGDAGLTALCRGPRWDKLLALRLDSNHLTDAGGVAFARLAPFPQLRSLRLDRNQLGDDTGRTLARCPLVRTLRVLNLSHNRITFEGALRLAVAFAEGPLRQLRLTGNAISRRQRHRIRDILRDRVVLDP